MINIIWLRGRKCWFSHASTKKHFFKIADQTSNNNNNIILPLQYPKHNLSDPSPMVRRGRPTHLVTPPNEAPLHKYQQQHELVNQQLYNNKWQSPGNSYALSVALIGPVNSGKSQLMGKLSTRVSAVSPKTNTTNEIIQAYKSFTHQTQQQGIKNIQLKYYDTPGIMYNRTGFISKGWKVLSEVDFTLLVIDSAKRVDQLVKQSIKRVQSHRNYQHFMKALVLNKIDLVDNKRKFHSLISQVEKYGKFDKIFYTSAITAYGVQSIQQYLLAMAKKKQWEVPKQVNTNLTQIDVYEEMFKQALFNRTYKEIPYQIGIQCVASTLTSHALEIIKFKITVRTQNQQRMLIGKQGANIQNIINRFNVLFAQMYHRQCRTYATVIIRDRYNQKNPGTLQYMDDDVTGIQEMKQKIAMSESLLQKQNKLIVKS